MHKTNEALWMHRPGAALTLGPAPYTPPGEDEVVVRVRAVALNPVDNLPRPLYRLVHRGLTYPAIIGWDVAGEVVQTGPAVTHPKPGTRVAGIALGLDRSHNRAAEGAFQRYVVLHQHMLVPIPDHLPFEQAAVLPMAVSIAATGLFEADHLALELPGPPGSGTRPRPGSVIVWGGSTAVGSNAIQLARSAGYRVVTTASPRNDRYVRSLGAEAVVDYRSRNVIEELVSAVGSSSLAGILAIGDGSLGPALKLAALLPGRRRISSTSPDPVSHVRSALARRNDIHVGLIRGPALQDTHVGPAVFTRFLPAALAAGAYRAAPTAMLAGAGLQAIPAGLARLRRGVSAQKLVVTL
ncbi:zinc-binding alcohol dehydrogenase family protein [Actinoplanes sp. N902-109]|uniref:zinc-binding alcohol dehydrogenase family protein n=1 Tax=Actinoplanes sp. (strain N902-109) TaxID=649831 RepID=UPI0003293FB3|nr:zinc-binding alcohol dehydrogenase family protein [Actinoplanes sp. N902-109]AGL17936.1 oxidoreductase, zinc-binding dehydrogenase family superfamily [Actinoplanes sp. N902-109]